MHGAKLPPEIIAEQMKVCTFLISIRISTDIVQIFWLTVPFYNASLLCAKATILMQYYRVFATRPTRIASVVMIAVLAAYGTWAVVSAFLNCVPVEKFWKPSVSGHCLSKKGLWFSNAAMHITTDIAVFLIPLPALSALQLPKRQKIAMVAIFALGGL